MISYLVTPFVLALALFGGTAAMYNPEMQAIWLWLAVFLFPAGIYLIWRWAPAATVILIGGAVTSGVAMVVSPASYGYNLMVGALGVFAFGLFASCDPLPGIRAASIPWLILYQPVTVGLLDGSTNVFPVWCYLFAAAWLDASMLAVAPLGAVALASGSRGAVLALLGVLAGHYWQSLARWRAWLLAGLAVAALVLFAVQPGFAMRRFQYWRDSFSVSLLGAGPGSVGRVGVIDIANGRAIPHAHNILVDALADYGVLGLAALALGLLCATRLAWPRWVLLAALGLAVHGLVDNPVYWLGPGVFAAGMLAKGVTREKNT